jgi:hypothetical protein
MAIKKREFMFSSAGSDWQIVLIHGAIDTPTMQH